VLFLILFSSVCFIPSVPGSHTLHSSNSNVLPKWGHEHLASLLHQHASVDKENSTIIMQCSSIGSLGPTPISWLVSEFAHSMDSTIVPKEGGRLDLPNVKVVYPCFKDVASSLNGVLGGGCLPYSKQGHAKQMWFSSFLQ
jgi:tyrosyl-DNA phosphodiesterase-1